MTSPTRPRRRWPRAASATVVGTALFVTAGLIVAPPASSQEPVRDAGALPARYAHQKPAWHPCKAEKPEHECATIEAPLNYRRPAEAAITLAISRIRASSPERRRGILVFNPGGPGAEGVDEPVLWREKLPKEVTEQYDLVGFDPRGVGASSPVTCPVQVPGGHRPKPETFAEEVAAAREYAARCARSSPAVPHITTRNTARDMDLIRSVLGERKLSYLGLSYGTYLGAVYTQMFGHRADRIVLDSAVDPAGVWRRQIQADAANVAAAFERWTRWTAQRDSTYHLGATPQAVRQAFWDLVAKASLTPISVDGGTETGDGIRSRMEYDVFFVRPAAERIAALRKAATGAPSTAHRAAAPTAEGAAGPKSEPIANMAITCNDARWPSDPEIYRREALRDGRRYPLGGYPKSSIAPCAFWPNPHAEPTTAVRNNVGALIVQNEWDPQAPVPSAFGLHRALGASRLVLVDEGEGHIVYGKGNRCADAAVNTYLSTGELPAADVTCRATA